MSNQRFHLVILALVASLIGVPAVGAQPEPKPVWRRRVRRRVSSAF